MTVFLLVNECKQKEDIGMEKARWCGMPKNVYAKLLTVKNISLLLVNRNILENRITSIIIL
jgi:hypothetical protein